MSNHKVILFWFSLKVSLSRKRRFCSGGGGGGGGGGAPVCVCSRR